MRHLDPLEYLALLKEFGAIIVAIAGGILAWIKLRKAPSWPTAQGTVNSAWSDNRACHLTYSYSADNEYYSGTHVIKARNEKHADELVSTWKGRSIAVRYAPENHADSVVLRDDQVGGFGN